MFLQTNQTLALDRATHVFVSISVVLLNAWYMVEVLAVANCNLTIRCRQILHTFNAYKSFNKINLNNTHLTIITLKVTSRIQ